MALILKMDSTLFFESSVQLGCLARASQGSGCLSSSPVLGSREYTVVC